MTYFVSELAEAAALAVLIYTAWKFERSARKLIQSHTAEIAALRKRVAELEASVYLPVDFRK